MEDLDTEECGIDEKFLSPAFSQNDYKEPPRTLKKPRAQFCDLFLFFTPIDQNAPKTLEASVSKKILLPEMAPKLGFPTPNDLFGIHLSTCGLELG